MSVQAISWVIEKSKHSVGPLIVLLMVANHARSDGTGAWPSLETLARESRLSERQTRRCLRILEKSGELITEIGAGPKATNLYSIPGVKLSPQGDMEGRVGGAFRAKRGDMGDPRTVLNRPSEIKDYVKNYFQSSPSRKAAK